jgi:polysaccharide deacetylase family protein (PEP-CTERM system associated)
MHNERRMTNALTIDLEDWFCVENLGHVISRSEWNQCELRVVESTTRLLDLFDRHDVKGTFFVLGWIAERVPDLVREVARRGHEIASHGYHHHMLTRLDPVAFEEDLCRSLDVLAPLSNGPIVGYRAPSFSVTERTMWALPILERHGFAYDSSIFPIGFHPDYGIKEASLEIGPIASSLVELPMSCATIMGTRVPCSGGGYFRIFPYSVTRYLMRRCNQQNRPVIFYLHPWEVDPGQPRVSLPASKRFRHYANLRRTLGRLDRLLGDFRFAPIGALPQMQSPMVAPLPAEEARSNR